MFRKDTLVFLVLVFLAAIIGFGLLPGIAQPVELLAKILFFVFLTLLVISLFDVVGESFRRG
jgi:uncharacterized membrane protein YtjA (UPF0391 family)